MRISWAVTKTLTMSTIACTDDLLTAHGADGSGMTNGAHEPVIMLHIAGSPDVWRAGDGRDSNEFQMP